MKKVSKENKKKTPKVRFPGFNDDWEEKKCKDIAPLQRGFDLPVSNMIEGKYPVVMSNGIGGYHNEYKVKGPGVITGRSGTIGKLQNIATDYWPHNTSIWVTDFKGNYPKIVFYLYQKLNLSKFGTGSGVPTLNRNDVHDTLIHIPSHDEQKKISMCLDNLDHLITLHQRKLEKLKEYKKGMLQKMFPKNGEKIPEVRFPGFDGEWKERKVSELCSISTGKSNTQDKVEDGKYPFYVRSPIIERSTKYLSNIKEEYSFLYRKRDDTSPCRLRTRLRASSRPSMNSIFFVKKIRIKLLFSEKIRHIKNNRWNTGACLCNIGRKKDGLRPEAPTSARASGGEFT